MIERHLTTRLFYVALIATSLCAAQAEQLRCPGGPETEIWVLAGQSNMSGCARRSDSLEPNPNVFMFNMDNTWRIAEQPLHRLFESTAPVHKSIFIAKGDMDGEGFEQRRAQSSENPLGGVGPGLFFAGHIQKSLGRPVALIPCAHGGTSLQQWSPELKHLKGNSLYGAMLERIEMTHSRIAGLVWYQGESEAMEPSESESYDEDFITFIDCLREDLNCPDLPVLFVQIGRWCRQNDQRGPNWQMVREKQRQVSLQREHVFMVPVIDLPLEDEIHLSWQGQARLGMRLAETALSQVYELPGHSTPVSLDRIEVIDKTGERPQLHLFFNGVDGKLQSDGRPAGFKLACPNAMTSTPDAYRIEFDAEIPNKIIVRFAQPIPDGAELTYGPDLNPYCNIVDSGDMALMAFGPLRIP